jgi:hypothetical protein
MLMYKEGEKEKVVDTRQKPSDCATVTLCSSLGSSGDFGLSLLLRFTVTHTQLSRG